MPREVLEAIGELHGKGHGSVRIAMSAHRIIEAEGPQVVSVDSDGQVYVTPLNHRFSQQLLKGYQDCIAGTYTKDATCEDIRDDLVAQWQEQKRA